MRFYIGFGQAPVGASPGCQSPWMGADWVAEIVDAVGNERVRNDENEEPLDLWSAPSRNYEYFITKNRQSGQTTG